MRYNQPNLQVLEVATRELLVGDDLDLAVTLLGDLDGVAEVVGAAINLDAVVKELLEGGDVEDLVAHGLRGVDDELRRASEWAGEKRSGRANCTFLVTLAFLGPARFCNAHLAYCSQKPSLAQEFGRQQSSERTMGAILTRVVWWLRNAQRNGYPALRRWSSVSRGKERNFALPARGGERIGECRSSVSATFRD